MKKVKIKIEGVTPLLQHRMNEEELFKLLGSKSEKKKPAEEKTPRQIAEGYAYKNGAGYYIPMDYMVGAFKSVAADYKQKNSTRRSLKGVAAGVFRPAHDTAQLLDQSGKPIDKFEVDIRKATNHQKGAVAVCRPRFDKWQAEFEVMVDDSIMSMDTAHEILNDAGKRSGIGSFRVSKGGYFGQFRVTSWNELN